MEFTVLECSYSHLVAMDWMENVPPDGAARALGDNLCALLQHCLLAAREVVNSMTFDKVTLQIRTKNDKEESMQVDEDALDPNRTGQLQSNRGFSIPACLDLPGSQEPRSSGMFMIVNNVIVTCSCLEDV